MALARSHRQVVLIVEDQAIIRMELVDTFEDEGFEVLEAAAAAEALTLLAGRPDVEVLFTDVDMPGKLNGFTLARVARKLRPELVILVASGHMTPETRDLPPDAKFLPKPYTPTEAISAVNALVEATRQWPVWELSQCVNGSPAAPGGAGPYDCSTELSSSSERHAMFGTMFTMSMMALEAQQVIWLRTLKMAAGGPAAEREATLMITEKVTAAFVAMTQLATGSSHDFVLQGYRSKVQANAVRLSR